MSMDDDLRWFLARLGLETNPEPTTAILRFAVAARSRSVCEDEESFGITAPACQPLQKFRELLLEHCLQSLSADVTLRRAVEFSADCHVVGRDGLRHCSSRAADGKEPSGNLLARADLGERAVRRCVKV